MAGVIPLGAAWAENSNRDKLGEQNPQAIFSSPQELIPWIDGSLK
jgi:phosphoglycolate phosphatase-like HAD superfamily hydrolase